MLAPARECAPKCTGVCLRALIRAHLVPGVGDDARRRMFDVLLKHGKANKVGPHAVRPTEFLYASGKAGQLRSAALAEAGRGTFGVLVSSNGSTCGAVFLGGLTMVDMWMLSVAAALIGAVEELDSTPLTQLEEAVRAVPGLGDALDAARAANESDRIHLAEELANGLKAAYDGDGAFAALLDALWPEVLFGPRAKWVVNVHTGDVNGSMFQLGVVGSINFAGPPSPTPTPTPSPPRSRFSFFGFGRRAEEHRP